MITDWGPNGWSIVGSPERIETGADRHGGGAPSGPRRDGGGVVPAGARGAAGRQQLAAEVRAAVLRTLERR